MKAIDQKRQATRRKTLRPLSSREVCRQRIGIVGILRRMGYSIYSIRQITNLTPDQVRGYLAKGARYKSEMPNG